MSKSESKSREFRAEAVNVELRVRLEGLEDVFVFLCDPSSCFYEDYAVSALNSYPGGGEDDDEEDEDDYDYEGELELEDEEDDNESAEEEEEDDDDDYAREAFTSDSTSTNFAHRSFTPSLSSALMAEMTSKRSSGGS